MRRRTDHNQTDTPSTDLAPAGNRIADFSKLSYSEVSLILKLADEGQPQTAIAQVVGCHQSTVSRVLNEFADTRDIAKRIAHSSAERLTKRVIADADVDQSLEVLDRIGVLEKRESGTKTAVQVNVGVSL